MLEHLEMIQGMVCDMEKELSAIDRELPSEDAINAMPEGKEKEQITHLCELLQEAFNLIDEILGAPEEDEDKTEGNGIFSIDDLLQLLPHGKGKRNNLS
ncbi:MAG: hypothetical protein J6T35_07485 [Bacteroidales bacterium]|nr:hypothetical protein [Bacteroidales bacterium]